MMTLVVRGRRRAVPYFFSAFPHFGLFSLSLLDTVKCFGSLTYFDTILNNGYGSLASFGTVSKHGSLHYCGTIIKNGSRSVVMILSCFLARSRSVVLSNQMARSYLNYVRSTPPPN